MQPPSETLPLKGLHLPDVPSWFPFSTAWWLTFATIIICICLSLWILKRYQQHRLAKNTALKLVAHQSNPTQAMEILRQVAFSYYPRHQLASLTGHQWYEFLDEELGSVKFTSKSEIWQSMLYTENLDADPNELVGDCEYWIRHALPPKKRGRN
ncbi:DUF4381 domain-containing protein [Vibrio sp. FNV 38]|nr:DUF4381 domain-containing protein [Vibrio sp. FNV 38]